MDSFVFSCPNTGREIDPGLEDIDLGHRPGSSLRFVALHVRCAHCGEHHEIKLAEAVLDEAA
jgi:hypothetical protein